MSVFPLAACGCLDSCHLITQPPKAHSAVSRAKCLPPPGASGAPRCPPNNHVPFVRLCFFSSFLASSACISQLREDFYYYLFIFFLRDHFIHLDCFGLLFLMIKFSLLFFIAGFKRISRVLFLRRCLLSAN